MADQSLKFKIGRIDVKGRAEHISNCLSSIVQLPTDKEWEIIIRPWHMQRKLAQNNLMWAWHTQLAKHKGETKESVHFAFKKTHVVPVLLAEDEHYATVYMLIRENTRAVQAIVHKTSTTDLSPQQLWAALEEYDMTTSRNGFCFEKKGRDYEWAQVR